MNKVKAFETASKFSKETRSVYVVFEKAFGDYGVTPEEEYFGDEDLIIDTFYNGSRE